MLPKKNWTVEQKMGVWINMTYAVSAWVCFGCLVYNDLTKEKEESLPTEDLEILKDAADVDYDQLLAGQHEVYTYTYTSMQTSRPLSTRMSQFYYLNFKTLEKRSPEKYPV